jgi:hypothetical protein
MMNGYALSADDQDRLRNTQWRHLMPRERRRAIGTVPIRHVPEVAEILTRHRTRTVAQAQAIASIRNFRIPRIEAKPND